MVPDPDKVAVHPDVVTSARSKSVTVSEKVMVNEAPVPVRGDDPDARTIVTVGATLSAWFANKHNSLSILVVLQTKCNQSSLPNTTEA